MKKIVLLFLITLIIISYGCTANEEATTSLPAFKNIYWGMTPNEVESSLGESFDRLNIKEDKGQFYGQGGFHLRSEKYGYVNFFGELGGDPVILVCEFDENENLITAEYLIDRNINEGFAVQSKEYVVRLVESLSEKYGEYKVKEDDVYTFYNWKNNTSDITLIFDQLFINKPKLRIKYEDIEYIKKQDDEREKEQNEKDRPIDEDL